MKATDKIPSAEEFKAWRERMGLSRTAAAAALEYSNASAISQMETGLRKVPRRVALMMRLIDLGFEKEGISNVGNTATES